MAAPMVERTLECCRRAVADSGLTAREIDAVVLVGGSTRIPLVRQRVGEFFGREPLCTLDPDQVVALGVRQRELLRPVGEHADDVGVRFDQMSMVLLVSGSPAHVSSALPYPPGIPRIFSCCSPMVPT